MNRSISYVVLWLNGFEIGNKIEKKLMIILIIIFSYLKKIFVFFIFFVNVMCYIFCIIWVNVLFYGICRLMFIVLLLVLK